MATISQYYFAVCTRGAARRGIDVAALLARCGIGPAQMADPHWRGSAREMARLVRRIWAILGDEHMGFTGARLRPGTLAFACELALEQPSVAAGLARAVHFLNLATDDIHTALHSSAAGLEIRVTMARPDLDPDNYAAEFWMMGWHRLACWLAGETIPLLLAEFDYDPPEPARMEMRHMFPGERRFAAAARRIVLDPHVRAAPVRRDGGDLRAMVARAPLDLMTIPSSDQSLARRVRQLLVRQPQLTSVELARAFGEPLDVLRRRLRHDRQPLSAIREAVQRDKATQWLRSGHRSVETIAEALGYAEARSFTRAFRRWTGMSPTEYRRQRSPVGQPAGLEGHRPPRGARNATPRFS